MDIVGFAVVGLGMGRNRARIIKDTAGAALRVVVDLNAELARETALELECDWTSELAHALDRKDVQVVMVMTPSGHHAKIGVQAAKAGKHVISTKPMDVTTEACDALIDAADQAGVLLGVDYESRYVAANYRLAKAIERGWLGKLLLGEARFKWFRYRRILQAESELARYLGHGRRRLTGKPGISPAGIFCYGTWVIRSVSTPR